MYASEQLLLPSIPLPEHLRCFLTDASDPLSARELRNLREGWYSNSAAGLFNAHQDQQEEAERSRAQAQLEDELVLNVLQDDTVSNKTVPMIYTFRMIREYWQTY